MSQRSTLLIMCCCCTCFCRSEAISLHSTLFSRFITSSSRLKVSCELRMVFISSNTFDTCSGFILPYSTNLSLTEPYKKYSHWHTARGVLRRVMYPTQAASVQSNYKFRNIYHTIRSKKAMLLNP